MFSVIAVVCCALLALQASLGFCHPTGKTGELHPNEIVEKDEDDGYQVVLLRSPSQVLKVEVVDEDGHTSMQNMELYSEEKVPERSTGEEIIKKRTRGRRRELKTLEKVVSSENASAESAEKAMCNWRKLYRLYLNKLRSSGTNKVTYSKNKRKEIRAAFKIVCENPEDAITYLLNMVPV